MLASISQVYPVLQKPGEKTKKFGFLSGKLKLRKQDGVKMKEEIWPGGVCVCGFQMLACSLCRLRRDYPEPPSSGVGVLVCRAKSRTPLACSEFRNPTNCVSQATI